MNLAIVVDRSDCGLEFILTQLTINHLVIIW